MRNSPTSMSLVLAFVCLTTFTATAQKYTLDDAKHDATTIVVLSSQVKGEINVILQQKDKGKANIHDRLRGFDKSFGELENAVYSSSEQIMGLVKENPKNGEELLARTTILIRHMMLMSDEKVSFSKGDQDSGARLRNGMQDLKILAQDIRKEVTDMKNAD